MFRDRKLILLAVAVVFVLASFANLSIAFGAPGVSAEDAKKFMPVSELKRGMKGYGLTVFQGTKIEKFNVEILGVLKKMNTGKDLILVRCEGGPVTNREAGIIAGMSGSPVYINGKLVGAVSYGAGFAKEPVGMLTPIADMLEAWDENLPKQASGYSSPQMLAQPVSVGGKSVEGVVIDAPGKGEQGLTDGILHMQPLMTPMMVSGLSPRGINKLAEILQPYHIQPIAGPGSAGKVDFNSDGSQLVPGAAVGMSLASGDIDLTSIGTLTYRRGNKIVAFGHPMLDIGAIDAPMTTAYVVDVLSSYQTSTKLASPIKTVGRVFQDRPWSIAGEVGGKSNTIPVNVNIDDQAYKRSKSYKVNVIDHPLLASRLATMIVGEAIYNMHPVAGDATAEVSYEIVADQIGPIKRSNVFFDAMAVDSAAVSDVGTVLQLLSSNPFHPVDIKSVNVNVKIKDKRNTATIDRAFVKKSDFEPGETVDVGVVLRPYKGERVTRTYQVKIPATATDGKISLLVRGGGTQNVMPMGMMPVAFAGDDEEGVMPGSSSGLASADNVKQLIDKYLEREKNNQVVLQLQLKSTAINVAGEKLTGLPSTVADIMKSSRNSGVKLQRDEVKESYDEDMVISGIARLSINVKRTNLNETPAKSAPASMPDEDDVEMSSSATTNALELVSMPAGSGAGVITRLSEPAVEVVEDVVEEDVVEETSEEPAGESAGTQSTVADPAPKSNGSTQSNVKTVVRQAKTWSQRTQADFAKGVFSGVSASSDNKLEISPAVKKLVETSEQFVWSLAPARDGVYAGTGNSGKILHITDKGESKTFFETGELEVHSLVRDASGNIYAATSPNGKVFKVTPDGKGKVVLDADERYMLALAVDRQGNVYAGTGDAGKVYKITPDGASAVFTELNEQQVLSLHWNTNGYLLIGTGINGIVYKADAAGKAAPVFDAAEDSIASVVSDSKNNIYAGTASKGVIYKISPDGRSKTIISKPTAILSMAADAHDNIYAVNDGTLMKISPDGTVTMLDSSKDKVQFLSVLLNKDTDSVYASTANIGAVYLSKCCDVAGVYESPVHDTKMVSRWGKVKWTSDTPEGTEVELQTRVGNVANPDSTWSAWSAPYKKSGGENITGPNGRYIQYKVTMRTAKEMVTPKVSSVTVTYLTPNQAPTVKLTAPTGGEVWSGEQTIKWTGTDPDKDTLTYDVYYSKDGKQWTALVGGMSGSTSKVDEAKIVEKVNTELAKSKDVPEDMKAKITEGKPETTKPANTGGSAPSSSNTTYKWATKDLEDGAYLVKIVASDKTSNATDALTHEVISDQIIICNSAPLITLYKRGVELKGAGSANVDGSATSELVEVAGVQYRINGGAWAAAAAKDGMYDSTYEIFEINTDNLKAGEHKLEIQAIDAAGNASSETMTVKVS